MASRRPSTEQLLDAWRRAESAINAVDPGTADHAVAIHEATSRREAYQHRIDELEDEHRSLMGQAHPPKLADLHFDRPIPDGDASHDASGETEIGEPGGVRTHDTGIKSPLLYR
jgi:hypothetical protein